MNKCSFLLIIGFLMAGCTDYSSQVDADYEEWREKQLDLAMDSITATIKPDTIRITDTVPKFVTKVDTVKKTVRDTITVNQTKYDTVTIEKVISKVDTIMKRDTITKVHNSIDTVQLVDTLVTYDTLRFTDTIIEIHHLEDSQEILRDTSITLSLEQDGAVVSRTFYGKVANGVFYDTTLYQYGVVCKTTSTVSPTIDVFPTGYVYCDVGYYAIGAQLSRTTYSSDGNTTSTEYDMVSKCGLTKKVQQLLMSPKDTSYFAGWRTVSEQDIKLLGNEIVNLFPADSSIFLSVSYASHPTSKIFTKQYVPCYGGCSGYYTYDTYVANIATQYGITTQENPTRYMCAYNLNQVE